MTDVAQEKNGESDAPSLEERLLATEAMNAKTRETIRGAADSALAAHRLSVRSRDVARNALRGPRIFGFYPLPPRREWLLEFLLITAAGLAFAPIAAALCERIWVIVSSHTTLRVALVFTLCLVGYLLYQFRERHRGAYGAIECAFAVTGAWYATHAPLGGAFVLAAVGSALYVLVRGLDNAATSFRGLQSRLDEATEKLRQLEPALDRADAQLDDALNSLVQAAELSSEAEAIFREASAALKAERQR